MNNGFQQMWADIKIYGTMHLVIVEGGNYALDKSGRSDFRNGCHRKT